MGDTAAQLSMHITSAHAGTPAGGQVLIDACTAFAGWVLSHTSTESQGALASDSLCRRQAAVNARDKRSSVCSLSEVKVYETGMFYLRD